MEWYRVLFHTYPSTVAKLLEVKYEWDMWMSASFHKQEGTLCISTCAFADGCGYALNNHRLLLCSARE